MDKYGEIILKTTIAKSPIQSIACFNDNQRILVGQLATEKESPTLSIINIDNGELNQVIKNSEHYSNNIWKVKIDKSNNNLIYLLQRESTFEVVSYDLKRNSKESVITSSDYAKYKSFVISPDNCCVIGVNNKIQFWNLEKKK